MLTGKTMSYNYVIQIRALKQALDHGLILEKFHKGFEFNEKTWLEKYIDMNIEFGAKAKKNFEKDFLKFMNKSEFRKTLENVRRHRDISLVTANRKRIRLVAEQNYHTTKWFSEKLLALEKNKSELKMNLSVYLGLLILEIS